MTKKESRNSFGRARGYLTSHIEMYRRRRKEYEDRYKATNPEQYRKLCKSIWRAMDNWRRQIKRLDEKEKVVKSLYTKVKEFTGYYPSGTTRDKRRVLARGLYYKWGMENGIPGNYLRMQAGHTRVLTPSNTRMKFTRSLSTSPENRTIWKNFKKFMEEPSNQLG